MFGVPPPSHFPTFILSHLTSSPPHSWFLQLIHRRGTEYAEWLWGWKLLVERWKRRSDTLVAFLAQAVQAKRQDCRFHVIARLRGEQLP